MVEFSLYKYNKFILCLLFLIDSSMMYKNISLIDNKLCFPFTKHEIKLGTDSTSGLILNLGKFWPHTIDWHSNILCNFKVDSSNSNYGIFVVIQNIVFRKNETTDECIDYVQYKRRDGSTSKKYCGRFNAALAMDHIFAPDAYTTNLTPTGNSFVVPVGKVDVTVYISKESLKLHDEIDLEIVFTSFRFCFMGFVQDEPCHKTSYKEYCIYKDFLNDGYVNCPYPDCVDEGGCTEKVLKERQSVGNKVIMGSVTILMILFVFFVCFIWLCRKYKKLCWSEEFANPNGTNQIGNMAEVNAPPVREIAVPSSTRTSVTISNVVAEEDKDLPPSYDSLFPDR